jgi:hypothetical protein
MLFLNLNILIMNFIEQVTDENIKLASQNLVENRKSTETLKLVKV